MTSGPITSWQIDEKNLETVADFIFLGSKITADGDWNQKIKRHVSWRKAMANHFVVQLLSWVHSLWLHGLQHVRLSCLSLSQSLLRLMSTESMMPSKQLVLCCPLLLLPSVFPNIRVFSNESPLHIWWLKYWSFSFIISPFRNIMGDFLRIDWCDLLADSCLLQHHIMSLGLSLFYGLTLSLVHDYWKNHSFDYRHFTDFCWQNDANA